MHSVILIIVYIAAMVVANLTVWWLGPWVSPINAFVLIGLDLTMRDVLHERINRWQLAGVICVGGLLTYLLNPGAAHIAAASAIAFFAAALADWLVYAAMASSPWLKRSIISNVAGAAIDSIVFPSLAFGAFLPLIMLLQFAAKVCGGALWAFALKPLMTAARR
jgi:hypothetical protein